MNSQPIASDLSYEVLKLRRRRFELQTPELDSRLRNLYPLPSVLVQREAFMADRESVLEGESHLDEGAPFFAGFNRGRKARG